MKSTVYGIILAGGNGSRMNLQGANKVTVELNNKPLVQYGVELLDGVAKKTVVVVGVHSESVKKSLQSYQVEYAEQKERLGTAHATQCGLNELHCDASALVIVGYGDHMMFYKKNTLQKMIKNHFENNVDLTFVTSHYKDINLLAYGRVLRDTDGKVKGVVEQKDATEEEKKITEFNAGLYCFNYSFLRDYLPKIKQSPISHEFYLTDLIHIGIAKGKKIYAFPMPFNEVGIGINHKQDFLYNKI